jgi:hypothetical protein
MTELLNIGHLLQMARATVSNPREGAATILRLELPIQALWLAFGIVIVLSMLMGEAVTLLMGMPDPAELNAAMMASPITMGLIQGGFLLLVAHGMTRIGQLFGGTGDFSGALALIVWLQFIFLVVQVIQLAALLIMPPVAGLITILAMGLFFWLLVNFIATLHGFNSLGLIFVATILTAFGFIFVLSLVLTMIGVSFGAF